MIRSIRCRPRTLALVVALVGTSAHARAEDPDPAATALFRQGRELLARGEWDTGCDKLAQSFARQANASTLLNLARCDEHAGKLATAWARHQQAMPLIDRLSDPVRRDELRRVAREGIARLEPLLPKLHVDLTPRDASLIDEAGRAVPSGSDVPLDPGPHTITARAEGHEDAIHSVELAPGRTTQLVVRLGARAAAAAAPSKEPLAPARAASAERPFPWLAAGVGGLGLGLGAIGVAFGVDAANASGDLRARCGADLVCNEDPSFDPDPLNDRKNTSLAVAIGFGAAGAVAIGVATWLLLRQPRTAAVSVLPSRHRAAFVVAF